MPSYTFKNIETGEIQDKFMTISSMEEFVAEGEWKQIIGAPQLVTHTGNIVNKTSGDWKDHLKKIKGNTSRFLKNSINT